MILGIGNDIIEVSRIGEAISRHGGRLLDRLFTEKEKNYLLSKKHRERHIAGRFAAKEAIVKALGTGFRDGLEWTDIEILNDPRGKPHASLTGKAEELLGDGALHLTISHCREYASAVALFVS